MRTRAPDFAVMPPHRPFLSTTSTLCITARVRWNARLAPMTPAPMIIASALCGIAVLLPQSPRHTGGYCVPQLALPGAAHGNYPRQTGWGHFTYAGAARMGALGRTRHP